MMTGKILVVDDSAGVRTMLRVVLERWGYDVLCAADGVEALEVLARDRCPVVISDVNMPRMDGIILLGRIKERYPECAVIMLTGEDRETITPLLLSQRAHYVISKTDFYYELLAVLRQLHERNDGNVVREPPAGYGTIFTASSALLPRATSG